MTRIFPYLRHRLAAVVHDLVMIPVAWLGAYLLRFNLGSISKEYLDAALVSLPVILVIQGTAFWYFGLYRGVWRFASLPDLVRIVKAVGVGVVVGALGLFLLTRMDHVPRSIFPLYGLLLLVLLGGPRLIYRWFTDHRLYTRSGKRVLIVGAGGAGEMVVREMLRDPERTYDPMGFIDDDRAKKGRDIQGVRVYGTCDIIPEVVRNLDIEVVQIAVPSATATQMRHIVEACETAGVPFQTLPPMAQIVSGKPMLNELREVSIEDLLGRDPVSLDWSAIKSGIEGKSVLISGGGGSIGSELCRQVARLKPAALVVLEQSEFNYYQIDRELTEGYPGLSFTGYLGDVTDELAVNHLLSKHRPDVVLHAAAYKHVPILESHIREAVNNNVRGTRIMAMAADRHGCEVFVLISTDKAVNPANVMGATKRAAEIFCQNFNQRSKTRFITVRFGNVLGSAGSVVPLFTEQIRAGGPVTVTHPRMMRYFMTISEACQLILQASVMGRGGEIFVLDMGQRVSITYLAEQMIRLSGREPEKDIRIVYTGLRAGEKLFEELFHENERVSTTQHEKILLVNHRSLEWGLLEKTYAEIDRGCEQYAVETIMKGILRLVPELQHSTEDLPENVIQFEKRQEA
jgi:FlaA1/EpsC-like NDP-sugar epimerase